MRIVGRLSLLLVLLGPTSSGCALLDGSSRLEEALEYLPAASTTVAFTDGGNDQDWPALLADTGLDATDVVWEAVATAADGSARVWKTVDDLDFDAVAARLAGAGHERSGAADRPTFTAGSATLALVPDEELVVSGSDVDALLAVVTDDADSLADAGSLGDLLDHAGDQDALEYAALTLAPPDGCDLTAAALFVPDGGPVRAVLVPESGGPRVEEGFGDRAAAVRAFADQQPPFGCVDPA